MSLVVQEVEEFQNQHCWKDVDYGNEEERELEEALSLSDLPISAITIGSQEDEAKEQEEDQNAGDNLDNDFDFGSLVGSRSTLDGGEMCIADEVFSGGQILPYRNSVSSMSGLRSVSRSDSMDRRGFASRSSSSRSSSIRSHYSNTSSSGSSSCSSNITTISAKTFPLVSQAKVQNQFHSYPSPRPQILGSGTRLPTYMPPVGKKSKMWEVLKLGLVRTPEIELQDLKLRHRTNNNIGKAVTIPRNNSTGSSSGRSNNHNNKGDDTSNSDRARKSCSVESNRINSFILEMQKRKSQMSQSKNTNGNNGGFFKSCKCSVGAIEPIPSTTRSNYGNRSGHFSNRFGNNQKNSSAIEVLREDKNSGQKNVQMVEEHQKHQQQQQQQKKRSSNLRQGKQVTSHQHHHRTFEWLKNLSHASVLNDS